jgi:uncharacterized protein (TIGR02453 family)
VAFDGFSERTIAFLAALSRHNERAWFEAHQAEYESAVLEPSKDFVETIRPRLRELDPKIQAIPKVRGSIKALERRARFPRRETPQYKDHLDLWFWSGQRRMWDNSGFFLRLTPTRLVLAAGMIEFQKPTLARYREHLLDEERGPALASIVRDLQSDAYVIGGESYKRTPRGISADHPLAALAKHGALFATSNTEHPPELSTPAFVDFTFAHFERLAPLHRWLRELRA